MHSPPRRQVLMGLGLAALGSLGACGFALRQAPQMHFQRLALLGFAPRSPLAEALKLALQSSGITVTDDLDRAEVILEAQAEGRERSVVASTSVGQVRELQLRLKLNFSLRTPVGRELAAPAELLLTRDLSTNETSALAKEQEEALLFRAMQSDVVQQVLRRLAAVHPG